MRSVLIAVCFFAFVFAALAQTDRGTITGTVSDPAGAVIAAAAIEAKNVATGAVYPTASSATGNYTIAQLPAGAYELSITVAGFKKFIRTGLVVEVAGTLRIDAALEVGTATESVTVTEAATLLKTEGGEVSQQRLHRYLEQPSHPHAWSARRPASDRPTVWAISGIRCPRSNCCRARASRRTPSCALTACLPTRNPSTLKARTPPTGSSNSRTRSIRRAWKRSRKWPSKPAISRPSMARRAAGTSTTP